MNLSVYAMNIISVAGENNSFNCTVTKTVRGLKNRPQVIWTEDGMEKTMQNTSSAILTFSKLNTSHGKIYTCQGSLSSPALLDPLIVMKNYPVNITSKLLSPTSLYMHAFNIFLSVPIPRINITLPQGSLIAGTNLSVICNIVLSTAVVSSVLVNVTWLNGSIPITNDTNRVSISLLSGTKPLFTSILTISPLTDVDSSNNFLCQASASSDDSFIETSEVGESSTHISVMQRS